MATRLSVLPLIGVTLITAFGSGCGTVPQWQYRQSQLRTMHMYRQNQTLAGDLGQTQQLAGQLAAEKQQLEQVAAQLEGQLQIANQRLDNLTAERQELHSRYRSMLASLQTQKNPLSSGVNLRFEELARKYPDFEFDPQTGVSKFNGDLLFASGSDSIRPEAKALLEEFAEIINSGDAQQFNILVVGHTDDQPIKKASTRSRHETNWELSAHRATSVVKMLAKYGVDEPRMGVAGYSKYQPVAANANDGTRQQNRRVEIYVLAPDAVVAGREPETIQR